MIPRAAKARPRKNAPPHADHWPTAILLERAAYLCELAKQGDGQASETLKEYPRHTTMLSFRARDGVAELHENFADLFFELDSGHGSHEVPALAEPQRSGIEQSLHLGLIDDYFHHGDQPAGERA